MAEFTNTAISEVKVHLRWVAAKVAGVDDRPVQYRKTGMYRPSMVEVAYRRADSDPWCVYDVVIAGPVIREDGSVGIEQIIERVQDGSDDAPKWLSDFVECNTPHLSGKEANQ